MWLESREIDFMSWLVPVFNDYLVVIRGCMPLSRLCNVGREQIGRLWWGRRSIRVLHLHGWKSPSQPHIAVYYSDKKNKVFLATQMFCLQESDVQILLRIYSTSMTDQQIMWQGFIYSLIAVEEISQTSTWLCNLLFWRAATYSLEIIAWNVLNHGYTR